MAGLYIHIPFCVQKCRYCDFVSFADHSRMGEYCIALRKELALAAQAYPKRQYETVFIGGGTPSILPADFVCTLLDALRAGFCISPEAEISMECNPGTAEGKKLRAFRAAGINRLSIGLQSADDGLLRRIGRIHDFAQFRDCFARARAAGFENINVDLMYGLPTQRAAQYLDAIGRVAELGAEHISAYSLILEEGTPLYGAVQAGKETLPDEDETDRIERDGRALLAQCGYARYEISNYARQGFACRHNLNYWDNGEYLGLGLNASSALRLNGRWTRLRNTERLPDYLSCIAAGTGTGKLPVAEREEVGRDEEMFECIMLGLRKIEGVERRAFAARFGADVLERYPQAIRRLRENGWLREDEKRLALSAQGLDFQNRAAVFFLEEKLTELSS